MSQRFAGGERLAQAGHGEVGVEGGPTDLTDLRRCLLGGLRAGTATPLMLAAPATQ